MGVQFEHQCEAAENSNELYDRRSPKSRIWSLSNRFGYSIVKFERSTKTLYQKSERFRNHHSLNLLITKTNNKQIQQVMSKLFNKVHFSEHKTISHLSFSLYIQTLGHVTHNHTQTQTDLINYLKHRQLAEDISRILRSIVYFLNSNNQNIQWKNEHYMNNKKKEIMIIIIIMILYSKRRKKMNPKRIAK